MKNFSFYIVTVTLVLFVCFSCEKSDAIEPSVSNQSEVQKPGKNNTSKQLTNPSLQEFIDLVDTQEEIDFFENTEITDNTNIVSDAISTGQQLQTKPKVSLKWAGKGGTGHGCKKPLGICVVFADPLPSEANVDLMIYQNKYILLYEEGQLDNGLTSDGYLPILENVYVDEDITILAGIYKANFDTDINEYNAVGIDIQ